MGSLCSKCLGKEKNYKQKEVQGIEEDPVAPQPPKEPEARRPPVAQNQQEDGRGKILTNEGAEIDPRDVSKGTDERKTGDRREPEERRDARKKGGRSNGRRKHRRYSTESSDDSSDSSSSSSSDSDAERSRRTRKSVTHKNGGTTIISKQFNNYGGKITNIKNVDTVTLNIVSGGGRSRGKTASDKAKQAKKKPDPKPAEPVNRGPCKEFFSNFHTQETMREMMTHSMTSPITRPVGFLPRQSVDFDDANTMHKILDMKDSVCKVYVGDSFSTGFCVGRNKVFLTNHAREDMTGTDHLNFVRRDNQEYLCMADGIDRDSVYALFKYDSSNEDPVKYSFEREVHFFDKETDTAVLSLKPKDDQQMPKPFKYFSVPNSEFVFIGHPNGQKMKYEPVKNVVNIDDITKREISELRLWCQSELGSEYQYDNPSMADSIHRLLFHSKMSNGCSGSPGLALVDGKYVVVVTMFLHKYPDFLFESDVPQSVKDRVPENYRISQGANMFSVYDKMKEANPGLCEEIFHSWQD